MPDISYIKELFTKSLWFAINIFKLKFVFCALLRIRQVFQQPDHIVLQQPKSLCSADRHLFFFHILKHIDPLTNIYPTTCTTVSDNGSTRILLRGDFIDWLPLTFEDLACVVASNSLCEHAGMHSYGNVTDREQIVF